MSAIQRFEEYKIDRKYKPYGYGWTVAVIIEGINEDADEVVYETKAGGDDYIEVYTTGDFVYIVNYNPSLPYVGMSVYYTEDGELVEECFFSEHEIPEGVDIQNPDPELLTPYLHPAM